MGVLKTILGLLMSLLMPAVKLRPSPYDHLLAGLGAYTAMTLRMYASRKELPLEHIKVELNHTRNYNQDCDDCRKIGNLEAIARKITLKGNLTDTQRNRLLEIADKCPVHKTLHNSPLVVNELVG